MVLTVSFVLPGGSGFLVTVACGLPPANLTPASRRQDHTTSPSCLAPFVNSAAAPTASRPAFVTTAKRPSCRDGTAVNKSLIWVERQAEWTANIFRKRARQ